LFQRLVAGHPDTVHVMPSSKKISQLLRCVLAMEAGGEVGGGVGEWRKKKEKKGGGGGGSEGRAAMVLQNLHEVHHMLYMFTVY